MTKDNCKKQIFSVIGLLVFFFAFGGCDRHFPSTESSGEDMAGFYEASTSDKSGFDPSGEKRNQATDQEACLYVHVCGAVHNPGLYRMPAGSRAGNAVEIAGGFTETADIAAVNLASPVEDGQQIYVPDQSEAEERPEDMGTEPDPSLPESGGEAEGKININTADASELMTLKGVGKAKAERIIAYRQEHGGFSSVEEIKNVSGIGEGIYNSIKDCITV